MDRVATKALTGLIRIVIDKGDWLELVVRILEQFTEDDFAAAACAINDNESASGLMGALSDDENGEEAKRDSAGAHDEGQKCRVDNEDAARWALEAIPGQNHNPGDGRCRDDRFTDTNQFFNSGVLPESAVDAKEEEGKEVEGDHIRESSEKDGQLCGGKLAIESEQVGDIIDESDERKVEQDFKESFAVWMTGNVTDPGADRSF